MPNKTELVGALSQSFEAVLGAAEQVNPDAEIYPSWTIKEVIAHLAGWDKAATASLSSFIQGGTPDAAALKGRDAFNAASITDHAAFTLNETVQAWENERQHLIDTISALPEQQINDRIVRPWGGQDTVANLLLEMVEHENHHAREIQHIAGG